MRGRVLSGGWGGMWLAGCPYIPTPPHPSSPSLLPVVPSFLNSSSYPHPTITSWLQQCRLMWTCATQLHSYTVLSNDSPSQRNYYAVGSEVVSPKLGRLYKTLLGKFQEYEPEKPKVYQLHHFKFFITICDKKWQIKADFY